MVSQQRLHVAAAVIGDGEGRVLLSLRPRHLHQGGLWEFPGGKVAEGETAREALRRELQEELGIVAGDCRPLMRIRHDYPDRAILLDVWRVSHFDGSPRGREGQLVEWVPVAELHRRPFPAANRPVVMALQLPSRYLITPEPVDGDSFLQALRRALGGGISLVQLRARTLGDADYAALARRVIALCRAEGARVLLNRDAGLAMELGADGVHLDSRRLMDASFREVPADRLLAASCHNRREVEQANRLGVDFMVISPVLPTPSHPGATPLGWEGFRTLSGLAAAPAYALGGMTPGHLDQARESGAQGIAAIRAFQEG